MGARRNLSDVAVGLLRPSDTLVHPVNAKAGPCVARAEGSTASLKIPPAFALLATFASREKESARIVQGKAHVLRVYLQALQIL